LSTAIGNTTAEIETAREQLQAFVSALTLWTWGGSKRRHGGPDISTQGCSAGDDCRPFRNTGGVCAHGPDKGNWWMWCIKWNPTGPLFRKCQNDSPWQFLRIGQKYIHYIHLIHQLVGEPSAKRTASASYYGQWRVGFVVGTEFKNWRRARVQDNTTSWISCSPTFVNSRTWRRVYTMSSAVMGFVGLRASS